VCCLLSQDACSCGAAADLQYCVHGVSIHATQRCCCPCGSDLRCLLAIRQYHVCLRVCAQLVCYKQ
jgi:hypothetical protein